MSGITIKAAAEGASLELALIGEVGWDISASMLQQELVGRTEDLTINLFSYGGGAIEGLAIYSMLSRYPGKKRMVIDGVAASAASVIAMAGDEIVMPELSFLMIHEAWGLAIGGSSDLRQQADLIDRISTAYRQAYSARSGMSGEDVASLMTAESWLTAAEAVEFGFATEVAPARAIRSAAVPPRPLCEGAEEPGPAGGVCGAGPPEIPVSGHSQSGRARGPCGCAYCGCEIKSGP